tara:strand:- start:177 stop:1619 length:1443 start_codon:yes stop_codon:yes gene_type:complete
MLHYKKMTEIKPTLQKELLEQSFDNYYNINKDENFFYGLGDNNKVPLDKKLDNLFNKKTSGIFIDVGAHDGIMQSNTLFFEINRNWNGIIITPNIDKYNECLINRPNSITERSACVSSTYNLDTIQGDFWRLNGSIDCYRSKSDNKETVPCATLTSILDKHLSMFNKKFNKELNKGIDLINIDTGAFEYEVLCGLDLNKYDILYILIEILSDDYDKITKYLLNYGYQLECNLSNYNKVNNKKWDGTHNDYLFKKINSVIIQIGSHTGKDGNDPIFNHIDLLNKKCIFIEPVLYNFNSLVENYNNKYPNNNFIFINNAISEKGGDLDFYFVSENNDFDNIKKNNAEFITQLGSFNENHIDKHKLSQFNLNNINKKKIILKTITINSLIHKYNITNIELLHIDTEGHDYNILMSLDLNLIKPDKIIFEHTHIDGPFKFCLDKYLKLINHFKKHNYKIIQSPCCAKLNEGLMCRACDTILEKK